MKPFPLISEPISAEVTRYTIGPLLDHEAIHVELTCRAGEGPHKPPHDWWAVRWFGRCLNQEGEWEFEPQPSSREDDFLARTRFTRDDALEHGLAAWARHRGKSSR